MLLRDPAVLMQPLHPGMRDQAVRKVVGYYAISLITDLLQEILLQVGKIKWNEEVEPTDSEEYAPDSDEYAPDSAEYAPESDEDTYGV